MLSRRSQRELLRMIHREEGGISEGNDFGGRWQPGGRIRRMQHPHSSLQSELKE